MKPWRTAIAHSDETHIWLRGYDVAQLMRKATFADVIFLLHRERLPTAAERALLDAILLSSADHGAGAPSCAAARVAASGNRQSLSAAIAAGLLAIGDEHGGAGSLCMELIAAGIARARAESIPIAESARRAVAEATAAHRRIPGFGHRVHTTDPRVEVLFSMARERNLAGDGIAFATALEAALREAVKPLPMNIDGALAAVLHDLGFPPAAGKYVFIIGRVAGLTAEVMEEQTREKPMRIRFDVEYDGPAPRPID